MKKLKSLPIQAILIFAVLTALGIYFYVTTESEIALVLGIMCFIALVISIVIPLCSTPANEYEDKIY